MIKVEIRDALVERATVNGRNGSFTSERQVGWVQLPSGETRRIRVRVSDGKAYVPGLYSVSDDSFIVSQYGDLQLGALKLLPIGAVASAAALVK